MSITRFVCAHKPYWVSDRDNGGANLLRDASGGAVFSTGSIAWVASLSHKGFDNNVSRITNVLRRFRDPTPL